MVDVEAPTGETLAIDDPALIRELRDGVAGGPDLTLVRSERAMTDCRPVSVLSLQSARQLGEEMGASVDQRRFRMNIYLDFIAASGFAENELVGRSMRIGSKVIISILERDPRCVMITLDPDTGDSKPEFLPQLHGHIVHSGRLRCCVGGRHAAQGERCNCWSSQARIPPSEVESTEF
jgi:hypothetical protein